MLAVSELFRHFCCNHFHLDHFKAVLLLTCVNGATIIDWVEGDRTRFKGQILDFALEKNSFTSSCLFDTIIATLDHRFSLNGSQSHVFSSHQVYSFLRVVYLDCVSTTTTKRAKSHKDIGDRKLSMSFLCFPHLKTSLYLWGASWTFDWCRYLTISSFLPPKMGHFSTERNGQSLIRIFDFLKQFLYQSKLYHLKNKFCSGELIWMNSGNTFLQVWIDLCYFLLQFPSNRRYMHRTNVIKNEVQMLCININS